MLFLMSSPDPVFRIWRFKSQLQNTQSLPAQANFQSTQVDLVLVVAEILISGRLSLVSILNQQPPSRRR
jgi:hypothetical protein